MTNEQLFYSIGVPIAANAILFYIFFSMMNKRIEDVGKRIDDLSLYLNKRVDDMSLSMNNRLDDIKDLLTEKLKRVEVIMDARLKNLEEKYIK
jgi:hypothetical protein